jgi:dipeptidyl aminopeptidase/acylaminoacyl peptidase
MREDRITFFSEGSRVAGILRLPDDRDGPYPAIVQGPGWLGLAAANAYRPWHEALVAAGYAVLAFDYRGYGESEGERGWVLPARMVEDIHNAVSFLSSRDEIDQGRIGAYGMGGIGGGNAILAAAVDSRIRCVAAQSVVADGKDWLRRMRREYEWVEFRDRVAQDSVKWAVEGNSDLVNPRTDIMVATPERQSYTNKRDVDAKIEPLFHLQSAAALMRYRPIDVVHQLAPRGLLLTCVVDDSVTPEDHAVRLYDRAGAPKRLVRQSGTTHYASYTQNYDLLAREIVGWYDRHMRASTVEFQEEQRVDLC